MKKHELIKELREIKNQYIDIHPIEEGFANSIIKDYANCLDHPQIEKYLLDSGIVSSAGVLNQALPAYKTAENIIDVFTQCYYMLEDSGLVRLKN